MDVTEHRETGQQPQSGGRGRAMHDRFHYSEVDLQHISGFQAYDRDNNHIGRINAIWTDESGNPEYVGIQTSWLFGRTHVVPADRVEANLRLQRVRLPYPESLVKDAPSYDPDEQLSDAQEQEVWQFYRTHAGTDLESISRQGGVATERESYQKRGDMGAERTEDSARIPLHEEKLKVGTRSVEAGGVRLRKIVRTETVEKPVQVQREDVVIERVPPGEARAGAQSDEHAFEQEDIFIPLRAEEPVVTKETEVREEVRARKTGAKEQETVRGTVRKEDLEVDDSRSSERERQH